MTDAELFVKLPSDSLAKRAIRFRMARSPTAGETDRDSVCYD